MSHFSGAVDFEAEALDHVARTALIPTDARADEVEIVEWSGGALAKVEIGAFAEPGLVRTDAGVVAVAGHPLLGDDTARGSRDGHRGVSRFLEAHGLDLGRLLVSSHGVFAAARWAAVDRTLHLFGDRLSIRPLFWWRQGPRVVFSTSLERVVEHPWVATGLDLQGTVEALCLGYPLEDRTAYAGIRRLGAGRIVRIDANGDAPEGWPVPDPQLRVPSPDAVLDRLRAAVARRFLPGPQASFLSGGLDSRVVTALVAERGEAVHTFNFSPAGSQDREYARRVAGVFGTRHVEEPRPPTNPDWSAMMAAARRAVPEFVDSSAPVWSGDGGSVCLGWVYVTPPIVTSMREGDWAGAVEVHLEGHSARVPERDLRPGFAAEIRDRLVPAVLELLAGYGDVDPAHRFFRFLVDNDQRRHLDRHFERILRHRTEFWLPFFDGAVVDVALRTPVDDGVGHRAYMSWFGLMDERSRATPWQTYPGHVPCPLAEEGLDYQWSGPTRGRPDPAPAREVLAQLRSGALGRETVRPLVVAVRSVLHLTGVRDSRGELEWLRGLGRYRAAQKLHPGLDR